MYVKSGEEKKCVFHLSFVISQVICRTEAIQIRKQDLGFQGALKCMMIFRFQTYYCNIKCYKIQFNSSHLTKHAYLFCLTTRGLTFTFGFGRFCALCQMYVFIWFLWGSELHHGHYQAIVPLRRPINLQIALGLNRHHDPMHDLNKPRLITNRFTNMMSCWFHQSCHKSTLKDTNTHTHTHIYFSPCIGAFPSGPDRSTNFSSRLAKHRVFTGW